jgi:hypothetical protein
MAVYAQTNVPKAAAAAANMQSRGGWLEKIDQ